MPLNAPKFSSSADEQHWQQLGNTNADGEFIYAVITTGIYCRPGCPSRRPNRDNVRFFVNTSEAEKAGFRPCKRCKPQDVVRDSQQIERITHLCRYIENAEQPPTLEQLANIAGISAYHLQRQFKAATGLSPKAYAKALQQQTNDYLRQQKRTSMNIYFSCVNSRFGTLLVAHSEKGICAILLGDNEKELITDLARRFPTSNIQVVDELVTEHMQQVVQLIEQPHQPIKLPLDIHGTLFQQKVWQALQKIPAGETRSYSEIATAIGSPKAVRAVADACAANHLAIAIPCHRVVRSDGDISGYRWGTPRKKLLLQHESDLTNPPSEKI